MSRALKPEKKLQSRRRLSHEPRHALNAVCPYYTMFPLEYPLSILRRYPRKTGLRLLDPFCGRGTSIYSARIKGHDAFGIDSSPIATAIAKAKAAACGSDEVIEMAKAILSDGHQPRVPSGKFWQWAFGAKTLRSVVQLRHGLNGRCSAAADLLRAVCLGALHGPLTKDPGNASYFSNQMPRTFSTKPEYSVRYWQERDLQAPEVDVLQVIRKRIKRLALEELPSSSVCLRIHTADARFMRSYQGFPEDIDLCISSPPFYGMRTYLSDQWLRNWFLGGEPKVPYREGEQLSHVSPEEFSRSLSKVWDCVGAHLKADGKMFIRFGSIPSRKQDSKTLLMNSLELSQIAWRVINVRRARSAEFGKRQAAQMGGRVKSSAAEEYDFEIVLS